MAWRPRKPDEQIVHRAPSDDVRDVFDTAGVGTAGMFVGHDRQHAVHDRVGGERASPAVASDGVVAFSVRLAELR